jgi:Xaa-Pro aminopeptidase
MALEMIGLDRTVFKARRTALMQRMGPLAIGLVPAANETLRNHDVGHPFRQDSDFWYLTNFLEPGALAVFLPGRAEGEFVLFVPPKDPIKEIWEGHRAGIEGAKALYGADQAFELTQLEAILPGLFEGRESIFYTLGEHATWDEKMLSWLKALRSKVRSGLSAPIRMEFLSPIVHEMRLIKSAPEIRMLRKAAQITVEGHLAAMKAAQSAEYEFEIQAALEARFKNLGSERVAFNSIVASGANACVLHYTENRAQIPESALILVDGGAEYAGYSGDVTHCFPKSGRFSPAQAQVYTWVLKAQRAGIAACQSGHPFDAPHQAVVKVLVDGLIAMGLIKEPANDALQTRSYERFFMHKTGHWLGMDVHDVGSYKSQGQWRKFQPGMVVTVEPGLYIPVAEDIPVALRGIGVRIEDDVLIQAAGPQVLTLGLPRTVEEIEAWMAQV